MLAVGQGNAEKMSIEKSKYLGVGAVVIFIYFGKKYLFIAFWEVDEIQT